MLGYGDDFIEIGNKSELVEWLNVFNKRYLGIQKNGLDIRPDMVNNG